ncbi:MAG TPA: NAD(P)H-binding protein [Rhodothermales bacterium]|nr:NAD(P)H-binding protein [Rhodothermales bacterium]
MTALLLGATGLVGRECLDILLADDAYGSVHVLTRRPIDGLAGDPKAVEYVIDFDEFIVSGEMPAVDHVFCALGTTMAKAGSKEAFRKVDYEYTVRIAEMALANGARHFALVSAIGANKESIFLYSRVKGEVEEAIDALGYPALTIIRPSVIEGERKERRFMEELGRKLMRLGPRSIQPVHARDIAAAMVDAARTDPIGKRVILSKAIPEV